MDASTICTLAPPAHSCETIEDAVGVQGSGSVCLFFISTGKLFRSRAGECFDASLVGDVKAAG